MEMEPLAFEATAIPDDIVYDEIIEEDVVLSGGSIRNKKTWYKGNVTLNGNVDFVNAVIRIDGMLLLQKGRVWMQRSTLHVDGDFRIQSRGEDESYGESSGYVYFDNDSKIAVYGNLYTQSTNESNMGRYGTYELHGNFYQIGNTYFRAAKMVFLGKGEQHVSFDAFARAYLAGLVVRNEQGKIYVDTSIPYLELGGDAVLVGQDIEAGQLTTNGYNLKIEGGFLINEKSSLYSVNDSTILIEGNLRIQSKLEDGTYGETQKGISGSGNRTTIIVTGDFYTQCATSNNQIPINTILEIKGNFHHIGDTWLNHYGSTGIVRFTGEGEQHISFDSLKSAKAYLGRVIVNNEQSKLYVDTWIAGMDLMHNTVLVGTDIAVGKLNLYGHDLKLEGNFLIDDKTMSHTLGKDATLYVDGDLRIQSKNEDGSYGTTAKAMSVIGGGRVVVKGNLYTQSTAGGNAIANGSVLELHGNIHHIGDTWFYVRGTLVFAGEGEQSVSLGEPTKFGLINFIQNETCTTIVLDAPLFDRIEPAGDVILSGNVEIHTIHSKRGTTRFKDSVTLVGKDINRSSFGTIIFDKDLTLIGNAKITPYTGVIVVKGNVYMKEFTRLYLQYDNDLMVIEGSLYNAAHKYNSTASIDIRKGCVDIKGDYIQSSNEGLETTKESMVQFSSQKHQTISSGKGWSSLRFYNLGLDPSMNYTFSDNISWTNLYQAYDTSKISKNIAAKQFGKAGTNAATGNYAQSFFDMSVPSIIGPLNITHTYNSLSETEGVLGKGFVFSQNMKLQSEEFMEKEHVTITLPNGAQQSFVKNAKGIYDAQDSRSSLTKSGTSYLLTGLDNTKTTFHENGNILSMEDRMGNRLTYQVNSDGNITSIQDITGTSISITYDGTKITEVKNQVTGDQSFFFYSENKLEKTMDATGKSTSYQYDATGFLSKITNHDGTIFEEITYISEGSHKDKVSTITNAAGNVSTYAYDDSLRKTTITDSNGRQRIKEFDLRYYITSTIDALGNRSITNYVIADGGNKYGETASETDVFGNTTSYTRDGKGNITHISYPDGSFESSVYDAYNNVIKTVNRARTVIHFIYDPEGKNLLKKVEPLDGILAYSESASQDLFAITTYTYDSSHEVKGLALTETRPLGNEENYIKNEYNQKGQLSKQIRFVNGDSYATSYIYNGKNLPIREVAPDGVVTEITYNKRDEVIRKKIMSGDGSQETVERTIYDSLGRKVITVTPLEYEVAKDNITEDTYSGVGTHLTYDRVGNIRMQTNGLGHKTSYQYDLYGSAGCEYSMKCYIPLASGKNSTSFGKLINYSRETLSGKV